MFKPGGVRQVPPLRSALHVTEVNARIDGILRQLKEEYSDPFSYTISTSAPTNGARNAGVRKGRFRRRRAAAVSKLKIEVALKLLERFPIDDESQAYIIDVIRKMGEADSDPDLNAFGLYTTGVSMHVFGRPVVLGVPALDWIRARGINPGKSAFACDVARVDGVEVSVNKSAKTVSIRIGSDDLTVSFEPQPACRVPGAASVGCTDAPRAIIAPVAKNTTKAVDLRGLVDDGLSTSAAGGRVVLLDSVEEARLISAEVEASVGVKVKGVRQFASIEEAYAHVAMPIEEYAIDAGLGASYTALHKGGRLKQYADVNFYDAFKAVLAVELNRGRPEEIPEARRCALWLIGVLIVAPWHATSDGRASATPQDLVRGWLNGRKVGAEWLAPMAKASERTSYADEPFTIGERGESVTDELTGRTFSANSLGASVNAVRATQMTEILRAEKVLDSRGNVLPGKAAAKRELDKSLGAEDRVPVLFSSKGEIFTGAASALHAVRMQWFLSMYRAYSYDMHPDAPWVQLDFTSRLAIGGRRWFSKVKGAGAATLRYVQASMGVTPRIVADRSDGVMADRDRVYELHEDTPALVSHAVRMDPDKQDPAVYRNAGWRNELRDIIVEIAAKWSPRMLDMALDLRKQLRESDGTLETEVRNQDALNNLLRAFAWMQRPAWVGFATPDACSGLGTYPTTATIEHVEGSNVDSENFRRFFAREMLDIAHEPLTKMDMYRLGKGTSSGPGTSVLIRPSGGVIKLGAGVVRDDRIEVSRVKMQVKRVVMSANGDLLADEWVDSIREIGTVRRPNTVGRRDDVGKEVRYIYIIFLPVLLLQLMVNKSFETYEKDPRFASVFSNVHTEGVFGRDVARMIGKIHEANKKWESLIEKILVHERDFPRWDGHITAALAVIMQMANDAEGMFSSWTERNRSLLAATLLPYVEGRAVFQVSDLDSDIFVLLLNSMSSGDAWTSKLGSLVNRVLFNVTNEFYAKFSSAGAGDRTGWMREFEWETNPRPFVPRAKPFTVNGDASTAQVFGDDALELLKLQIGGATGHEYERMIADLIFLTSWAIRQSGFGTNPDDLQATDAAASFLNVYGWGDAIWRRSRGIGVTEKEGKKSVTDQVSAFGGAVMSGMSIYGYTVNTLVAILTGEEASAFGYVAEVSVYTYLRPSEEQAFVTMLPYPRAPFLMYMALGEHLLPENHVDISTLAKISDKAALAAEDVVKRGRMSGQYLYNDQGPLAIEPATQLASDTYIDEGRMDDAMAAIDTLKTLTADEREQMLDRQMKHALTSGIADKLATDTQVGPSLRLASAIDSTVRSESMIPDKQVTVGERILEFTDERVYNLVTAGNGQLWVLDADNRQMGRNAIPFLGTVVNSASPEFLVMQAIFGIAMEKERSLSKLPDTGSFSPNTIPGSTALGWARDYSTRVKGGYDDTVAFLRGMGHDAGTAARMATLRNDLRFTRIVEDMEEWKSSRVPEMSLSIRRFEELIRPMVEKEIVSDDLPGEPAYFASELIGVVTEAIAAITVNSTLMNITAYMDRQRSAAASPSVADFYTRPGIHLGSVYKVRSTVRSRSKA
uniref:Uncharacterized protein n=1 Tax=viral metagenome TaxID=1070528 RepID=A0A2V0RAF0_9ZZZZ